MTSRIETSLRVTIVTSITVLAIASISRQAALARAHTANPGDSADLAILKANGDAVSGSTIRNSCGGIVHPTISHPAADMAIVIESDPTGLCVGSNPPSTMTVLTAVGTTWRPITSFPAATFRLGATHAGRPDLVFSYPPFHHGCPVLRWDGRTYQLTQPCSREADR